MDFNRSCLKEVDFNGIKFGRKWILMMIDCAGS